LLAAFNAAPTADVLAKGLGVMANGTSTVALLPGSAVAAWEYRREFGKAGRWFLWLLAPSVAGSLLGVLLVTQLRPEIFDWLVPWLILFAAILFAVQPRIARWITVHAAHERPPARRLVGILLFQTLVAIYGGYFGAG